MQIFFIVFFKDLLLLVVQSLVDQLDSTNWQKGVLVPGKGSRQVNRTQVFVLSLPLLLAAVLHFIYTRLYKHLLYLIHYTPLLDRRPHNDGTIRSKEITREITWTIPHCQDTNKWDRIIAAPSGNQRIIQYKKTMALQRPLIK